MGSIPEICCQRLSSGTASPFDRIVSLGYYDGTTHGLARCRSCGKSYSYVLQAWDLEQDTRVYSMAEVSAATFDAFVSELSLEQRPSWPVWVPNFATPPRPNSLLSTVKRLLEAHDPQFVIAASSPEKHITAFRNLTPVSRQHLNTAPYPESKDWEFWRQFLGIPENATPTKR